MADQKIEAAYEAAITAGKINGAVLIASSASGFSYDRALGHRTLLSGEQVPEQPDDILVLASATKLITTIAALQLVEDGKLSLTGDLRSVAPDLCAKEVLTGFADDGAPRLEKASRPITLEMLLTHSAGTSYDFFNPLLTRWSQQFDKKDETAPPRGVETAFAYPLSYQPGTSWMYGPGLDWAGRIVERVTGESLGENFRRRIFAPLGITDYSFFPVTDGGLRSRMVDLNPADPEGLGKAVLGGGADQNRRPGGHFGGHGLLMTGEDYAKVLRSLLLNDGKLLRSETVDDMFTHHLSEEATAGHQGALSLPMGPFFRCGTTGSIGHGLGGVVTLEDAEGWYGKNTLTWGGGLTFTWFVDRQNGLCGLAAVQAALPTDIETIETLKNAFRHDIYRKFAEWKKQQA